MHRQLLLECLPYVGLLVLSIGSLVGLLRLQRVRCNVRLIASLHRDEVGAVQSLSFVLTVPLFMMIMLFIVQLSQITIGKIVVEYAAQAAARSAQVWIPSSLGPGHERENQIAGMVYAGRYRDEAGIDFDRYVSTPFFVGGSEKMDRIRHAAICACLSISPSKNMGATGGNLAAASLESLKKAFELYAPATSANPKIAQRLGNKLRYAEDNTQVTLEILHRTKDEPTLTDYQFFGLDEFADDRHGKEFGWQDQVVVTVTHQFALLPGPGRLLAKPLPNPQGSTPGNPSGGDSVSERIKVSAQQNYYYYTLSATARTHNEGDKSAYEYVQWYAGTRDWDMSQPRVITNSGPYRGRKACPECPQP